MDLLRELVMQHMPASMHYKIGFGKTSSYHFPPIFQHSP
jgi:hypothetical protein